MLTSTETSVHWAAAILVGGGLIALFAGGLLLSQARRQARHSYVRLQRQTILRAWRNLLWGVGLLIAAGLVANFGIGVIQAVTGQAAASTPDSGATAAPGPPVSTPTVGLSAAARTVPPPATATRATGPTPTPNLTPVLPLARITPPTGTLTITPPAEAVVANLRLSRFNDCASQRGVEPTFSTPPKTLYALFDYDGWLPGMEWSSVWRRAGEVVHVETLLWDGSTGGCGFTEFDNAGQVWPEGAYEVQVFAGERWLGAAAFSVFDRDAHGYAVAAV